MMTHAEFKAIRKATGLHPVAFGRALGFGGADKSVSVSVRRYEAAGGPAIPGWVARLAEYIRRYGPLTD